MIIELHGLGVIIVVFSLATFGLVHLCRLIYDSPILHYLSVLRNRFRKFLDKIVIYKNKKIRCSLLDLLFWFIPFNKKRKLVANFYVWCRISYMYERNESYRMVNRVATYSLRLKKVGK